MKSSRVFQRDSAGTGEGRSRQGQPHRLLALGVLRSRRRWFSIAQPYWL